MDSKKEIVNFWENNNKIKVIKDEPFEIEQYNKIASLFIIGENYYYYVVNFDTLKFEYYHHSVTHILGYKPEEFTVDFFLSLIHPDDVKNMKAKEALILDFLTNKISPDEMQFYKKCYTMRFRKKDGSYATILHQTIVQSISPEGKVYRVLGIHTDISHLNIIRDNTVSIIGLQGRPSFMNLNPFSLTFESLDEKGKYTEREIEVLKLLADGLSVNKIAANLFVSPNTIKHHKKSLATKSNTNNIAELLVYAIRNGMLD